MPFSYQRSAKSGKLIPKRKLCPRCAQSRLNEKHGICNGCYRDVMLGRAGIKYCQRCNAVAVKQPQKYCPSCIEQIVLDRAKEITLARMQKLTDVKDNRPPITRPVPSPFKWQLTVCWNCGKPKGELIPKISLYCEECFFHRCREADCRNKAQYVSTGNGTGYYRDYCEEHYFQHIYCRNCGEQKEFSGLDFCPACSEKFSNKHQRLLRWAFNKEWRKFHIGDQLCIRCRREPQIHEGFCRTCLEGFGRAVIKAKRIPKPPSNLGST